MRFTPAVKTILIINIVFYALTYWFTPMVTMNGHSDWFLNFNALHPIGYNGFAWYQFLTYMFMHGGWWHLFFNMWSLMIFGCAVEQMLGTKRFWTYYLICGVGSALVNQLLTFLGVTPPAQLVGASGAIYGVMAAAAYFFPDNKLFIIPLPFPIKLKYLVGFYTVVEMYMGITSVDGVAHFAHLGGILVGIIVLLIWKQMDARKPKQRNNYWTTSTSYSSGYQKEESVWTKIKEFFFGSRKPKMRVTEYHPSDNNAADHAYNARKKEENDEIDRILDKIRKNGYQSLTETEKKKLFEASKSR